MTRKYPYEVHYVGAPYAYGEYRVLSKHLTYKAAEKAMHKFEESAVYYNNVHIAEYGAGQNVNLYYYAK